MRNKSFNITNIQKKISRKSLASKLLSNLENAEFIMVGL